MVLIEKCDVCVSKAVWAAAVPQNALPREEWALKSALLSQQHSVYLTKITNCQKFESEIINNLIELFVKILTKFCCVLNP